MVYKRSLYLARTPVIIVILFKEIDVYREAIKKYHDANTRNYPKDTDELAEFTRNNRIEMWTPCLQNNCKRHKPKVSPLRHKRRKSLGLRTQRSTRPEAQKDMTLNQYIEFLQTYSNKHPKAGEMRVTDTYDDDPCEIEIVDGTVVLAEEF